MPADISDRLAFTAQLLQHHRIIHLYLEDGLGGIDCRDNPVYNNEKQRAEQNDPADTADNPPLKYFQDLPFRHGNTCISLKEKDNGTTRVGYQFGLPRIKTEKLLH
jgi:hypothetical protein